MDITVKYTERAGHAFDIVNSELKPGDYDSIISVSGDGLIHEIVNGLCTRPDWTSDLRETPTLGFIPGGTANGLVTAVLDHTGETSSVQIAAFIVAKGRRMEMDVTEIEAEYQERKIYSMLSTAWAIIADCDINSEAIRCLGSPRFTIWGVMRLLFLRKYLGCVNFTGFPVQDKN
jgi:sphingosine kinase